MPSVRSCPARCRAWPGRRGPRAVRRGGRRSRAEPLDVDVERALELGGVGRRHGPVGLGAHGDPARTRRASRRRSSAGPAGASGSHLLTRRSGSSRQRQRRSRPRRCRGAVSPASAPVVRRTHHPRRARRAGRSLRRPSSPPRRPSRLPSSLQGALDELGQTTGLHPEVTGAALGRLEGHDRCAPVGPAPRPPARDRRRCRRTRAPAPPARHSPGPPRHHRRRHEPRRPRARPRRRRSGCHAAVRTRRRRAGGSCPSRPRNSSVTRRSVAVVVRLRLVGDDDRPEPRPEDEQGSGDEHPDAGDDVDVQPVGPVDRLVGARTAPRAA